MKYTLIRKTTPEDTYYAIVDVSSINFSEHNNGVLSKFILGHSTIKQRFWNPVLQRVFREKQQVDAFRKAGFDIKDDIGFYRYIYDFDGFKEVSVITNKSLIDHIDKLYLTNDKDSFDLLVEIILNKTYEI